MKRSWRVFSAVAVLAGLVTVSLFLMVGERMLRLPAVAGPGDDADGDSLLVVYNGLFDQPILAVDPAADVAEGEKLAGVVQDTEAALTAGLAVATDRAAVRHQIVSAEVEELEKFIQEHPQSAWVPSLRAHLGMSDQHGL